MVNGRLLFHLAVFSTSFRLMLTVIVRACMDLIDFMLILYAVVCILGLCNYIVNDDVRMDKTFGSSYQLIFGENLEDFSTQNLMVEFLYVFATNFLIVICLNILISIVTDNYDNVQQTITAQDFKLKSQMLYEMELVMFSHRRQAGFPQYIFEVSYTSGPSASEDDFEQ